MKTAACLLVLLTLSGAACADEAAGLVGEPGCQVARPILEANEAVRWKGPCKDGFADGAGVLERNQQGLIFTTLAASYEVTMARGRIIGEGKLKYKNGDTYTGSFKDGRRDGKGYTAFANGDQYDGDYKNDVPHGAGEALERDGTRYQGNWKDGQIDGSGSIQYALGGGYLGGWKDGKFHGKGVLTYAGSGRKREAEFDHGRVRGAPAPAPLSRVRYGMEDSFPRTASILPRMVTGFVPFNKSYSELTPDQQAAVKDQYLALEEGDEPPYPLHGPQPICDWLKRAQAKALVSGKLRVDVLVGKDGNPVSVKTIGAPSPQIANFAAVVMAQEKYKPAVCHGAPCDMVYRLNMEFAVE